MTHRPYALLGLLIMIGVPTAFWFYIIVFVGKLISTDTATMIGLGLLLMVVCLVFAAFISTDRR